MKQTDSLENQQVHLGSSNLNNLIFDGGSQQMMESNMAAQSSASQADKSAHTQEKHQPLTFGHIDEEAIKQGITDALLNANTQKVNQDHHQIDSEFSQSVLYSLQGQAKFVRYHATTLSDLTAIIDYKGKQLTDLAKKLRTFLSLVGEDHYDDFL